MLYDLLDEASVQSDAFDLRRYQGVVKRYPAFPAGKRSRCPTGP